MKDLPPATFRKKLNRKARAKMNQDESGSSVSVGARGGRSHFARRQAESSGIFAGFGFEEAL